MSQARSQVHINPPQAENSNNEAHAHNTQNLHEPERSRRRERSRDITERSKHHHHSASHGRRRHSSSPDEHSSSPKRQRRHKPVHLTVLKSNGSNFSIWVLKVRAAFRHAGIEHVLTKPKTHEKHHSSRSCQLGLDILLDMVDDALATKVVKPHSNKIPTPHSVMSELHELFGQGNVAMQSILRASLTSLRQAEDEKVTDYTQRAEKMFDDLRLAGGYMSSKTYLQCLKEGVLEKFSLTVRLFELQPKPNRTAAKLTGLLQADECRLARQESLRGDTTAPQHAAMVVTNHGSTQKWAPKVVPNKVAAKPDTCWNCGVEGHKFQACPKPIIKPLKFKPADFKYNTKRKFKQDGQPHVTA